MLAAISAFLLSKSPLVIFSILEDLPLPAPLSELRLKDQRKQLHFRLFPWALLVKSGSIPELKLIDI